MDHTNVGLVEYAKKMVGIAHYWFGCYGQLGTTALWTAKSKMYPQHFTASRKEIMKKRGDIGKPVCDCSGLIKGYLMTDKEGFPPVYQAKYDLSADAMYNKATEKGDISTIPEIPGLAVHRSGHIGIYIGNGKVIEAKGFNYGVIISDLKGSSFKHWLKIPYITYENTSSNNTGKGNKTVSVTLTRLSKGSKGAEVLSLQALLNAKNNAGLKLDGDFGNATEKASIAYMKKMGLEPDGIVGTGTWTALLTK